MNNILLCEGATDAILLSYYLEAVFGWRYCTPDKSINISEDYNETVNWYKKGNDKLVICSVGGKDRFGNFFSEKVLHFLQNSLFTSLTLNTINKTASKSIFL